MATFTTDINSIPAARRSVLEANAQGQGMTAAEYLASRGGLNLVTGKFGDSYDPAKDLTDAEYTAALKGKTGIERGAAINAATAAKAGGKIVNAGDGVDDGATEEKIYTASDGTEFTDQSAFAVYQTSLREANLAKETLDAEKKGDRQSAYDLLYNEFSKYGLGALVLPLRDLIQKDVSPSEFTIELRNSKPYQERFAANQDRVKAGLAAISEAEYIGLEDQYQNIMRNYGLPESYYTRGNYGTQAGFQKFIANDVSATELEDRIMTAQQRVVNANPEVLASLKAFYPGINNGDILAYTLDPKNALDNIKRKVTAAEIGGAATQAGLTTGMTRAEELTAAGITKQQAQQGFQTVAEVAPRGGQLAAMYGESPYTQQTAEQEVFGLAGSVDAAKQRKKLVGLERAEFSGQAGTAQGALGRERAGNF
jgi:hypothetical protein